MILAPGYQGLPIVRLVALFNRRAQKKFTFPHFFSCIPPNMRHTYIVSDGAGNKESKTMTMFMTENPAMLGAPMRVWRAEGAGRGVMADAITGGEYFFPRRETAELWAGERGTVVERIVDTAGASVQDVPEGEMVRGEEGAIIRRDPDGSGEVLEVVVFDDSLIRTASVAWNGPALVSQAERNTGEQR